MGKRVLSFLTVAVMAFAITLFIGANDKTFAASKVTGVKNVTSGIQVSWKKDKKASGYRIYKKRGSGKWYRVKTVKRAKTVTWTDKNVKSGTKYSYKVRSYKGKRVYKSNTVRSTYRLTRTKIKSLTVNNGDGIILKTYKNSKVRGFQVVYSTNKKFKSCKSITLKGSQFNKRLGSLSLGTKYYFKVRGYVIENGKKYYSAYSPVKYKKTGSYITAYTVKISTKLYKEKKNNAKYIEVPYDTKVYVYGTLKSKNARWIKIKYDKKYYYRYQNKNETLFDRTHLDSSDYKTGNEMQNAIVQEAFSYCNDKETVYVKGGKGEQDEKGRYKFDCSGFASEIINGVMTKYVPGYDLSGNIMTLYNTDNLYIGKDEHDNGGDEYFTAKIVCNKEKKDFDKLKPGDILFFKQGNEKECDHCGIYVGNGEFIHSTKTTNGVSLMPLKDRYEEQFICAKRVVPAEKPSPIDEEKTINKSTNVYNTTSCKTYDTAGTLKKGDKVTLKYILPIRYDKWPNVYYIETENIKGFIPNDGERI